MTAAPKLLEELNNARDDLEYHEKYMPNGIWHDAARLRYNRALRAISEWGVLREAGLEADDEQA